MSSQRNPFKKVFSLCNSSWPKLAHKASISRTSLQKWMCSYHHQIVNGLRAYHINRCRFFPSTTCKILERACYPPLHAAIALKLNRCFAQKPLVEKLNLFFIHACITNITIVHILCTLQTMNRPWSGSPLNSTKQRKLVRSSAESSKVTLHPAGHQLYHPQAGRC